MCCKSIGLRVGLQLFLFCKVLAFCLVVFVVELCFWVAPNGKSICEGRAKFNRKVQFRPTEANAFFVELNYKKNCGTKKQARLNPTGSSIIPSTPPFANTMLPAVSLAIIL